MEAANFEVPPGGFVPGGEIRRVREAMTALGIQNIAHPERHKERMYVNVTEAHLRYICEGVSTANYQANNPESPPRWYRVDTEYAPVESGVVRNEGVGTKKIDLVAYLYFRDVIANPELTPLEPGELMIVFVIEIKDAHHIFSEDLIGDALDQLFGRILQLDLADFAPRRPDGTPLEMIMVSQIGLHCRYYKVSFPAEGGEAQIVDYYHPDRLPRDRDPLLWDRDVNAPDSPLPGFASVINREVLQLPGGQRHPVYQH